MWSWLGYWSVRSSSHLWAPCSGCLRSWFKTQPKRAPSTTTTATTFRDNGDYKNDDDIVTNWSVTSIPESFIIVVMVVMNDMMKMIVIKIAMMLFVLALSHACVISFSCNMSSWFNRPTSFRMHNNEYLVQHNTFTAVPVLKEAVLIAIIWHPISPTNEIVRV